MSKARRRVKSPEIIVSNERAFEVIRSPMITEKATLLAEQGQYTFRVAPSATKPEIKAAVERLFGVKVKAVNTLCQVGKVKRFRGHVGKRKGYKKAMVTLNGGSIDLTAGL